jgi:3'(2'), 5'-bisphosphate nucleotidase
MTASIVGIVRSMSTTKYAAELKVAIEAVREAAVLCTAVQARLSPDVELRKQDKSPVTVADFGSQALICRRLQEAFPDDQVIGEESADVLREAENTGLLAQVVDEVRGVLGDVDAEAVCAWIDRGAAREPAPRTWTLDPIDGTKGFLRGANYAVALALIEEGRVVVAVLGGPNLAVGDDGKTGALFHALPGGGAWVEALDGSVERQRVSVSDVKATADMRWCESVEAAHQAHSVSAKIAVELGTVAESRRIDSMCKYGLVARGDADLYLRLPRGNYQENIWDHAAGVLVVTEAGGRASDLNGDDLDFGCGQKLGNPNGIVVSNGHQHDAVLEVVRRVRAASTEGP